MTSTQTVAWFPGLFHKMARSKARILPSVAATTAEEARWLEAKGRLDKANAIVTKLEESTRRRGIVLAEPDFARYAVPEQEKVPVGEVFKGQYLERTVVLLAVWLLLYAGIDYGFNAYSGVYVVDAGWSAHDLFIMILIGGAFGIAGLALNSFIGERIERKTSVAAAGVPGLGRGASDEAGGGVGETGSWGFHHG